MVTAATTASRVSPPFLKISIPRPKAFTPLALEIIIGRLPCVACAAADAPLPAPTAAVQPNRLLTLAAALPPREVRKNLRRDHNSIEASAKTAAANIPSEASSCQWEVLESRKECSTRGLSENEALRQHRLLDAVVVRPPLLPGVRIVAQWLAGDQPQRAVDPASRVGIQRIIVQEIQQIWNRAKTLLSSQHSRLRQPDSRPLPHSRGNVVRETLQQRIDGRFGAQHRQAF